jgi:L-2-hydroxyglutarate oxidase LhgO
MATPRPFPAAPAEIDVDFAVLGAGVVGMALAEALTRHHPRASVLVLERHRQPGQETSSRSSEVIHAGVYYWDTPQKAESCRKGRELLYRFCAQHAVPHRRCGKYILAVEPDQLSVLDRIARYAESVGVPLHDVPVSRLRQTLDHPLLLAGLWSPCTGIVDSHQLIRRLEALAAARGALFSYGTCFLSPERSDENSCRFSARDGQGQLCTITARRLFNAAGLASAQIASQFLPQAGFAVRPCRGRYFALSSRYAGRFSSLLYPVPDPAGGLGVHLTQDLSGRCRLGPDVDWSLADRNVEDPALYAFPGDDMQAALRLRFLAAGRRLLPDLEPTDLSPDFVGVRPKLFVDGTAHPDFWLGSGPHSTVWHLLGIESPGLTAALALADELAQLPLC